MSAVWIRAGAAAVLSASLLSASLLPGCMPSSHQQAKRLEGRYTVPAPGDGWLVVDAGGADHAWYNTGLKAAIYADSNCGPRYSESRTEDLATELTAGLRQVTTTRDELREFGGREGVLRVHSGRLDGVPVTLALGVMNRGACTYDLTFIAPPDTFEQGWDAYERILSGFTPL
ncbi:MAG: hypothetical protein Q8P18_33825 [Pseudomonadota bacterium]|nr:hypothetical protein [Pseudomonadota bacterium]